MRFSIRVIVATLALAATAGCSAAERLVGPEQGDLIFRLDAQSCAGIPPIGIEFFVNGQSKGAATLSPGGSKSFRVDAGSYSIGAKVSNINYSWPTASATVPANSSFTWTMICT